MLHVAEGSAEEKMHRHLTLALVCWLLRHLGREQRAQPPAGAAARAREAAAVRGPRAGPHHATAQVVRQGEAAETESTRPERTEKNLPSTLPNHSVILAFAWIGNGSRRSTEGSPGAQALTAAIGVYVSSLPLLRRASCVRRSEYSHNVQISRLPGYLLQVYSAKSLAVVRLRLVALSAERVTQLPASRCAAAQRRAGCFAGAGGRPGAADPGAAQPGGERGQVHRRRSATRRARPSPQVSNT